MLGILVIVLGMALATPVQQVINNAMGTAELNCTTPTSTFNQATCWFMQIEKPFITGLIIFIGFSIIVAKRYVIG